MSRSTIFALAISLVAGCTPEMQDLGPAPDPQDLGPAPDPMVPEPFDSPPVVDNLPPIANAGSDIFQNATVDIAIRLDASGSFDPDGSITWYEWRDADEGFLSFGPNPVLTDFPLGKTSVTLTVTDNAGASASDTVEVEFSGPPEGSWSRPANLLGIPPEGPWSMVVARDSTGFYLAHFHYDLHGRCNRPGGVQGGWSRIGAACVGLMPIVNNAVTCVGFDGVGLTVRFRPNPINPLFLEGAEATLYFGECIGSISTPLIPMTFAIR